jgi:hypothetical protein
MIEVGGVCLRFREEGEDILVYHLGTVRQAAETIAFVSEFLPNAQVVVEPLRH